MSTLQMRCGHAAAPDWRQAARRCLEQLRPVPPGANLGFLYFTDHFCAHADAMLQLFRRETGVPDWVGTVGMGVLATGAEYLDEPSLAVMVGRFPEDGFHVFSGKSRPPSLDEHTASGQAVSHFAVVHGDPNTPDIGELVGDMSRKLASGSLVGGLSCSRSESLQIANEVLQGGLSGVVLSGDVEVCTGLAQGCVPLNRERRGWLTHRVTQCEGNVITTLDGRPALDVFIEDVGDRFAADMRGAARLFLAGLPVGPSGEDFLARNIIGFDARHKLLAIAASVERDTELMFCRRDQLAAREDLAAMLDSVRKRLPGTPKGGLYIACIARGANMFGQPGVEMELIRQTLGPVPLVGFFANGEIAQDRLYGYTGVLTLFV